MARYLLWSLLLFSLLIRSNYALAQSCYCTTPYSPNSTFGSACTANADCWACQPGAYSSIWQQAFCPNYQAPTCQVETQTQTLSCPVNYSGSITQTRTKICPSETWTDWQTVSSTCTPNPPTCQVTTEQQTLSCQTGYTGNITQMRSSTCPNPYGQPVIGPWTTTTNTCVKSVTNPTNIASPVSPVSPVNPTSVVSPTATAVTTPAVPSVSAPQQMQTPQDVSAPGAVAPSSTPEVKQDVKPTTPVATTPKVESQGGSKGTTKETPKETPKGKVSIGGFGLVTSLEIFVKPGIIQPNVFPTLNIGQELPLEIRQNHQFLMELLSGYLPDQSGMFNKMAKDAIELEQ